MRKIYENLTLRQSIQLASISTDLDKLEYAANRLAVLFDIDVVDVYKREVADILALNTELERLEKLPINTKQKNKIRIGKRWFYIDYTIAGLTAAQFIDIQHFASSEPHKNIHKIIACVLKEISGLPFSKPKPYNGDKHEEISEYILDHMTIYQAYPITLFFCKILDNSSEAIQTYSLNKLKALKDRLTNS